MITPTLVFQGQAALGMILLQAQISNNNNNNRYSSSSNYNNSQRLKQ